MYRVSIGLEVHIQLATRTKAFSGDPAAFGGNPNTQISPVSLGYPGTLPRLNQVQVDSALRLGLALEGQISLRSRFDRKHYFYADLPKGYQITQDAEPICRGGQLPIRMGDTWRPVRIHHIHMEEDAGKSMHDKDPRHTLIDLNRAGVPLLELVTEPDLHSAEEVDAFMSGIRQLVRYLGISDGHMEEGSMRCDINISLRPEGQQALGPRCEIKNVNSMRNARRAITFEVARQQGILEDGGAVEQQTLHFDPATGATRPLRGKEEAHDYRYFPEPDLPPLQLTPERIEEVRGELPRLPWQWYQELRTGYGLPAYDAGLLSEDLATARYFERLAACTPHRKAAANLLIHRLLPLARERGLEPDRLPLRPQALAELLELRETNRIGSTAAEQQLLPAMLEHPDQEPEALARERKLLQTADPDLLDDLVTGVLQAHPSEVARYRKGKKALLGFFVGQVMKRSRGQADPQAVQLILRKKLA